MSYTYVIGEKFLLKYWSAVQETINYYGSIKLDNGIWRANFYREKIYTDNHSAAGTSFNLDICMNDVVRFSHYGIYKDKKGNATPDTPSLLRLYDVKHIDSIKFLDIGQDFITIEYNFHQD